MDVRAIRCQARSSGSACQLGSAAVGPTYRLEPLHPPALALLAMENGVPVAPAPTVAAGGDAATTAGRGPDVAALRAHRAVGISTIQSHS